MAPADDVDADAAQEEEVGRQLVVSQALELLSFSGGISASFFIAVNLQREKSPH